MRPEIQLGKPLQACPPLINKVPTLHLEHVVTI